MSGFFSELRRRGVLGALVAYGVAAAGALQLADIVVHNLDLAPWVLRVLIWVAVIGLPVTAVISWFYDLTRRGLVRTHAPALSPPTPRAITTRTAPPPGTEIGAGTLLGGRYRVEGEIGKGGMGRVLAARDERIGRRVAVKVVSGAHDPARIARFEQEARTAGALEHPNVLGVYDLGEHEGVPFLVTELLEGHTLRTVLAKGALPAAKAHDLSVQLARGLSAAHARGIVHRDLKPENLFVTNDGRLKILDFGLARLVEDPAGAGLTQTGAVFGSPGYLSPEQARGEKVGPASDVFSAGAVMYEMVSGRRAFPGATLIEAGHAALASEPEALPIAVPPALEGAIIRALQKDPARRFADGAQLAQALESMQVGAGAAIPTRRSTPLMVTMAVMALAIAFWSGLRVSRPLRARRPVDSEAGPAKVIVRHGIPPPAPPAAPAIPDPLEIQRRVRSSLPKSGRLGLLAGARALERTGRAEKAEDLLRKQRDPVAHLELFLLQKRQGKADKAKRELRAYLPAAPADWPRPLLQVFAGDARDADAFAAAAKSGDPDELCEANYYIGLLRESRELLQKAVSPECDMAEAAQERLEGLQEK